MSSNARTRKKSSITLLKPNTKHAATKAQKEQRVGMLAKIRRGFLKIVQAMATMTAVILIVYLSATVLLPTIGGVLSDSVGLSGQVHFYNMLQSWGFPMLCITGVIIIGDFYLCKYVAKLFREFFQPRIDDGFTYEEK